MPRVSVIMPMYNSVKYVKQAIESILNQSFEDLELIVINDGSNDGCADVVRSITDERLIFIDRENRGFINSLNEGIEMARRKKKLKLKRKVMKFLLVVIIVVFIVLRAKLLKNACILFHV